MLDAVDLVEPDAAFLMVLGVDAVGEFAPCVVKDKISLLPQEHGTKLKSALFFFEEPPFFQNWERLLEKLINVDRMLDVIGHLIERIVSLAKGLYIWDCR